MRLEFPKWKYGIGITRLSQIFSQKNLRLDPERSFKAVLQEKKMSEKEERKIMGCLGFPQVIVSGPRSVEGARVAGSRRGVL